MLGRSWPATQRRSRFEPSEHAPVACYVPAADRTLFIRRRFRQVTRPPPHHCASMSALTVRPQDGTVLPPDAGRSPAAGRPRLPALTVDGTDGCGSSSPSSMPISVNDLRSGGRSPSTPGEGRGGWNSKCPQPWFVPGQGSCPCTAAEATAAALQSRPVPTACAGPPHRADRAWEGLSGLSGRNGNKIGVSITFRQPRQAPSSSSTCATRDDDFGKTWQNAPAARSGSSAPSPSTPRAAWTARTVVPLRDLTSPLGATP